MGEGGCGKKGETWVRVERERNWEIYWRDRVKRN